MLPRSVYQFPFWMFRALTGGVSVVADVFAFAAPVDVARLQDAFARTIAAFDALWMRYPRWRPVQELAARRPHAFDVCISDDVAHEAVRNLARPFDLTAPPHVHARLVRMRDLQLSRDPAVTTQACIDAKSRVVPVGTWMSRVA